MSYGIVRRLRLGLLSAALAAWRIGRPARRRADGRGILLGASPDATVLIVWALDRSDPVAEIAGLGDVMAVFEVVVIVCDEWHAALQQSPGREVVILPDAATRARLLPEGQWNTWLDRRKAQIRQDWAPDFEIDITVSSAPHAAASG